MVCEYDLDPPNPVSALAVSLSVASSGAQAYSQVVAFGDSLSDTGNLLARLQPFGHRQQVTDMAQQHRSPQL